MLPPYCILPERRVEDLIQEGLRHSDSLLLPLRTPWEVHEQIMAKSQHGAACSLVRLGDGELLTLAHDTVLTTPEVQSRGAFLPYSGVQLPCPEVRDQLAASIELADIIGIPESRHDNFQGLLLPVFKYYHLDYRKLWLTSSTINYALNEQGLLSGLLRDRRILLVGNRSAELGRALEKSGLQVSAMVTEVNGTGDIPRVLEQIRTMTAPFDIVLVAAGIAAVILCPRIASEYQVTALDIGHLADRLGRGEAELI